MAAGRSSSDGPGSVFEQYGDGEADGDGQTYDEPDFQDDLL